MSTPGESSTPPQQQQLGGPGWCCSSGAAVELVCAFTAVCLVLYGVILYLNYLYVRWSRPDGVHRTGPGFGGGASASRKRAGVGGIDKAALAAMPVLRFKAGRDAAAECAVCLSAMQDGEAVRALPGCGHAFHAACVDAWLRARATCPVCRARPVLPPPQRAPRAGPRAAAAGTAAREPDWESQL